MHDAGTSLLLLSSRLRFECLELGLRLFPGQLSGFDGRLDLLVRAQIVLGRS